MLAKETEKGRLLDRVNVISIIITTYSDENRVAKESNNLHVIQIVWKTKMQHPLHCKNLSSDA